jgi:penicillin-binding protein 2
VILGPSHAWYVGYAPYNDPEIAVVVFIYNGSEGSRVAGPVARKVMEAYFCLMSTDPSACP